uniref:Uncharacterized protein n=1 Tax=Magallana gigas TaxID=29159 RepID=A0A8W8JFQ8_MAGGI
MQMRWGLCFSKPIESVKPLVYRGSSQDWHFGLWKVKWRHSTAETLDEVTEPVKRFSRNGRNIPQLINDTERHVSFYDWTFL